MAKESGYVDDNILLTDNGRVIEIYKGEARVTEERVPAYNVMVDGLGIGDVKEVVIRDRQLMAQDGIITAIVLVDSEKGKVINKPEIISKGFVYMKNSTKLIQSIQDIIIKITESKISEGSEPNPEYIQNAIKDELGISLFNTTRRRPMIIPVVIEL